jgi:hypothetical protein
MLLVYVGASLQLQRSSPGSQILNVQYRKWHADCGRNIEQMGNRKQRIRPLSYANACPEGAQNLERFLYTARPKVTRIEIYKEIRRASVV